MSLFNFYEQVVEDRRSMAIFLEDFRLREVEYDCK
jgi:hypothetical protein